ncbi:hypothetical protein GGTG_03305 [Gaeumannomyces tritici R3-111a-1]|uniref:Rhodopsin domain-containing protein n=1 Tax=Gaeumannomyces tritici (strain R3-111a-1) TaxID=644352 RepID=J3NPU8_GAET3|nr:hypothetical protein GGTG_03305 [Gaeumannomyces tritici R3-111a-1]EJT78203.1 hypothetical protein GGTG_03305 [Gaeumannomyces tritici R3-111a-1]
MIVVAIRLRLVDLLQNAVVGYGAFSGVGAPEEATINTVVLRRGRKLAFIWHLLYISSWVLIKASVCAALLRLTSYQRRRFFLVFLIGLAVAAAVAFLAGVLAQCSPIQAVWTAEQELCHNTAVVVGGFYLVSAVSIIADIAVAIISVVILGHVRIPKVVKRFVAVILSLGVLASVCSIIRLTYLPSYPRGGGDICNIGPIVLLSILETSIAIISAFLPMLCKLLGTVPRPSTDLGGAGIDLSTKAIRWNTKASPGHISLMELAPTNNASSTIEPSHDHHLATTTAGTRDTFLLQAEGIGTV